MNNKFIREQDGYINATELCKAGGKKISHWIRLDSTNKLLIFCEKYKNIPISKLLIVNKGNSSKFCQGSWVHPIIATNLAQWVSFEFSIKVCIWIEEWKQFNNNKIIYNNEIYNLKPDYLLQKEKEIQLKLQNQLGGEIEIEVETESGFIDLLTEKEIIEIKNGKNWKHALGQILIYSLEYPKHAKIIHLFGIENDENINKKCKIYNVNVTYEL
jgi:hypothetical protein